MPVAVACPKCKKKYSLPDKMLGKVVKCSKCEAKFKTPAGNAPAGNAKAGQTRKAAANPQRPKAQAASNAQAAEMKKLGIDGPIQRAPELFDSRAKSPRRGEADPLANHVVGDPGFAQVDMPREEVEETVDPLAEMYANPAIEPEKTSPQSRAAAAKKGKKKKKKKSKGDFASNVWFWIAAIFVPVILLGFICTYFAPGVATVIAIVGYVAFLLVSTAVGIWMLVETYKVSDSIVQLLLVIFVPFYALYFLIANWKQMKNVGNALVAQTLVLMFAGFMAGIAIATTFSDVVPPQ